MEASSSSCRCFLPKVEIARRKIREYGEAMFKSTVWMVGQFSRSQYGSAYPPKAAATAPMALAVVAARSYSGGRRAPPMKTASLRQRMSLASGANAAK
jgi:hypothetical protein